MKFIMTTINKIKLTKEQILMLQQSDKDIEEGRLITQDELDKNDLEWLKSFTFHNRQVPNP